MEIVLGQNDSLASKCAFSFDVGSAESFLVDGHSSLAITLPQYFAPVHTTAVQCAAVIKDDSFYHGC